MGVVVDLEARRAEKPPAKLDELLDSLIERGRKARSLADEIQAFRRQLRAANPGLFVNKEL